MFKELKNNKESKKYKMHYHILLTILFLYFIGNLVTYISNFIDKNSSIYKYLYFITNGGFDLWKEEFVTPFFGILLLLFIVTNRICF